MIPSRQILRAPDLTPYRYLLHYDLRKACMWFQVYLKPKYAAWPQAISSNSLWHVLLPKTISTQALFLDFGLLGVCHMATCHNPSQTIVCCLAACRNPSAPRVCHMAACRNPSAPRVCHMAACRFPSPKLEGGTLLCRLDACHFPSYRCQ